MTIKKTKKTSKKSVKAPAKTSKKAATKTSVKKTTAKKAASKVTAKTTKKSVAVVKTAKAEKVAKSMKPVVTAKTEKIGIFGGTFNPIHYGHLNSLETVQKALGLNEVWVVPTAKNPLRNNVEGASVEQRFDMAIAAMPLINQGQEIFSVRREEIERGGVSYTVDTIKEFRKLKPTSAFFLIIGLDQLENFSQWMNFKALLQMVDLVVTSRPGMDLPKSKLECPEWMRQFVKAFRAPRLKAPEHESWGATLSTGTKVTFLPLNDVEISSTEIRKKIRLGDSVASVVPSPVLEFIKSNKLYESVGSKIGDFKDFTMFCSGILNDKGGLSISAYDVSDLEQATEFAIATSGTSTRHSRALAEHVMKAVKETYGVYPQGSEGMQEGRWIVLDYGSLMIHVFYEYVRAEYRIEDLWKRGRVLQGGAPGHKLSPNPLK